MAELLRGTMLLNEPMANYTSWRVGGIADRFYRPQDLADLALMLRSLPLAEPILWVGLGSNLLVRDGGIRGTVINTQACLTALRQTGEYTIRAEAGVSCAQLARFSARLGLQGLEFMAGIPGTVGGALAMNAGCYGSETWQHVHSVECINRQGTITLRQPAAFNITYRAVEHKHDQQEWFAAGHFTLAAGNKTSSLALIREYLARRATTQPTSDPTCGSVFRNPPGDFAGRLIELCGLKGYRIGGAMVAEKHANFIVNLGIATASDIEALIKYLMVKVKQQCGIQLIPEVHIVGELNAYK